MAKRCNLTSIPEELYELMRKDGELRRESIPQTILRILADRYLSASTQRRHNSDTMPTSGNGKVDQRHKEVRELIMKVHLETFKTECTWGPAEAGQLGHFLKANPALTVAQIEVMLRNRFRSEGVSPERPMKYLADLPKYGAGPLDKFGKTKRAMKPAPVQYLA